MKIETNAFAKSFWKSVCTLGLLKSSESHEIKGDRLESVKGVFSKTYDTMDLRRVNDVRVKKGLIDNMFGCGTLIISAKDSTHSIFEIRGVKEPMAVKERILKSADKSVVIG